MSVLAGPTTPSDTRRQHSQGFSISSILSFLNSDAPVTPIRKVREAPSTASESPPRVLLPATKYPDPAAFSVDNLLKHVDTRPLDDALQATAADMQKTFSSTSSELAAGQLLLVKKMHETDSHTKSLLQMTHAHIRKTEKEAELLAGSERLSILAETCYDEVSKIIKLFAEIDSLLPSKERILHHSEHYPVLSQNIRRNHQTSLSSQAWKSPRATRAISSLRSIQENSPAISSAASMRTLKSLIAEQAPVPPAREISPVQEPAPVQAPRLRLAPRKSKSNLRVPQIRTVPPLPSTRLDTALPNIERDNFSTRSSVVSRASVFSTVSQFFMGQSSRRTVHEGSNLGPRPHTSAEERLRKISGSSTLSRPRQVSTSSRT